MPYEARRREPLIEPRFFRSVPFSSASVIAVCAFAALGAFLFINTLYLQEVRVPHLSAFTAGLCTLPIAAMTLFFAPLSGRIVGRRGPRMALLVGGLGIGLGGLLLTGTARHPDRRAAARLFPVRDRLRHGQPADHEHGGAGHARGAGRSRGGGGLDLASGRPDAGRGRRRERSRPRARRRVGPDFVASSHTVWWLVAGCGAAIMALGLLSTTSPRKRQRQAGVGQPATVEAGAGS